MKILLFLLLLFLPIYSSEEDDILKYIIGEKSYLDSKLSLIAGNIASIESIKNKKIAVDVAFEEGDIKNREFLSYIADNIEEKILSISSNRYKIIERKNISKLIDELKFASSGAIDEKNAAKTGKLLGVDIICLVSSKMLYNKINIKIKILNVETGEIIRTFSEEITLSDIKSNQTKTEKKDLSFDNKYVLIKPGKAVITHFSDDGELMETSILINELYFSKYEVTVGEWKEFLKSENIKFDWTKNSKGNWPVNKFSPSNNTPIINVSWEQAIKYCNWLSKKENLPVAYDENTGKLIDSNGKPTFDLSKVKGYRLPTEAEWEYVAKCCGKDMQYAWGSGMPLINGKKYANISDETYRKNFTGNFTWYWKDYDDGYSYCSPVGTFEPNELGIYDITGNVAEWCTDSYTKDYCSIVNDNVQYVFKTDTEEKSYRGGSWDGYDKELLVTTRFYKEKTGRYTDIGFRVVRTK